MKSFDVIFNSKNQVVYNGKTISRYYDLDEPGMYDIIFRVIDTNSSLNQAIVLFFNDFDGDYYLFDEKCTLPKTRFPKEIFWTDTAPNEIRIRISLNSGSVFVCNGSDPLGSKQICHSLHLGCAMYITKIGDNKYQFNCNDHVLDDDFDDLIFEMELR